MELVARALPQPFRRFFELVIGGECDTARSSRAALLAFSIRVLSAAIAFLLQVFLARWFGAHEFGVFTYVWALVNIAGTLCVLGFSSTVVRFLPEYHERGELELARGFLRTGTWVVLVAATVAALLGTGVLYAFDGVIDGTYRTALAIGLACLPAFAATDFQDGVGRAHGWIDVGLIPPYILRPLVLFGLVGTATGLGFARDAETGVLCAVVATWAVALVQHAMLRRRLRPLLPPGPRQYRNVLWARVAVPVLLMDGFTLLMMNLDVLLLKLFLEPSDIAVYFAAARTISLIAFVHFSITAVAVPRFAAAGARDDWAEVRRLMGEARAWTVWPSLAGALAVLAVGNWLLCLFGDEFTAGYPVMLVLAAGLVARAAAGPAQGLLVAMGQQNIAALVLGVSVTISICLNVALIPRFGLTGAAAASATAYVFEGLLLTLISRRLIAGRIAGKGA